MDMITKMRLQLAGHGRRSQNIILQNVLERNQVGRISLGRLRLRWKNRVENDVEVLVEGMDWKECN